MPVAQSGSDAAASASVRHGSNSDDVESVIAHTSTSGTSKKDQDVTEKTLADEETQRNGKPTMPRAKRVISFDDQTSRLSRSKLVIV